MEFRLGVLPNCFGFVGPLSYMIFEIVLNSNYAIALQITIGTQADPISNLNDEVEYLWLVEMNIFIENSIPLHRFLCG